MKHIVNLSGGKDSTAMLLMMLERGMPVDYVVFADTGKDFPQMLEHLDKLEHDINMPVTRLKSDKTFDYLMFDYIKTKGVDIGQRGYGWATMYMRWCTGMLKKDVINRFIKSLDDDYMQYIGIAVDEPKRLKAEKKKKYPLAEWNITETTALEYCYSRGYDWGGLYKHFRRVSCWCCPLQNLKELKALYKFFPDLWQELKDMDLRSRTQFKQSYSVFELEERFKAEIAAEMAQVSCFDITQADEEML